jgi:hypothetical protein
VERGDFDREELVASLPENERGALRAVFQAGDELDDAVNREVSSAEEQRAKQDDVNARLRDLNEAVTRHARVRAKGTPP